MTAVTGIGSWPGTDARSALDAVGQTVGSIDAAAAGVRGLPYVPELPARGPGADMIGRSACLLSELAVDLHAGRWRLADHAGVDQRRALAWWRRDRDDGAEVFDGWDKRLKLSFVGPWTLAAHLRLGRGERVLADLGAARDVAQSLAEGVVEEVGRWRSVLPGATWTVQLDEPSLPAVLAGSLRTSSGYRRHAPVGADEAGAQLREFVETVRGALGADSGESRDNSGEGRDGADPAGFGTGEPFPGTAGGGAALGNLLLGGGTDAVGGGASPPAQGEKVTVHCCAADVPFGLLRQAGVDAVAVDTSLLDTAGWEACAELLEAGTGVWAGLPVPLSGPVPSGRDVAEPLLRSLRRLGLGKSIAPRLTLTPACGLAGAESVPHAAAVHRALVDAAQVLRDELLG